MTLHLIGFFLPIIVLVGIVIVALQRKDIIEFDIDVSTFPPRIRISFKRKEQKKSTKSTNEKPTSKAHTPLQKANQHQEETFDEHSGNKKVS